MSSQTTVGRGYGTEHKAQRQRWQTLLDQGHSQACACMHEGCTVHSGACPTLITKDSTWDLGHTDDRLDWTGPECVPCNRAAGARNSRASVQNPMTVRGWCEAR